MRHKQITLDGGLEVDRGIAPLVAALNKIEGVSTVDSCEGDSQSEAYVYFRGRPDTVQLVEWLADRLRARLHACCEYRLRLEWLAGSEVMAEILTRSDYVDTLANALLQVTNDHTSQFADDTSRRAPRSSTNRHYHPQTSLQRDDIRRCNG